MGFGLEMLLPGTPMSQPRHPDPTWTDAELARRCGLEPPDDDAWRILWARYHALVVSVAHKTLRGAAGKLAEEATSDTFSALVQQIRKFDPARGKLTSFVATVARSKAMDALRRKRYRSNEVSLGETGVPELAATPAESFPPDLLAHLALAALRKLDSGEKGRILTKLLKQQPIIEIAAECGCSESQIRRVRLEYVEALQSAMDELLPGPVPKKP